MNKLIFTAILSGFAGLYAMGQNEIRLMDMDLNKSYQTYGGAVKGKSVTNEPASIQGKTYDDVIGVQAKSHQDRFTQECVTLSSAGRDRRLTYRLYG